MTAFIVAKVSMKNPEKFQEYAAGAKATFEKFGVELLARGKAIETFNGELDHQMTAIMQFSDIERATAWYNSPEYQALIPIRDEACDMVLTAYEVPQA